MLIDPMRLGEPVALERDGQGRGVKLDPVAETEGAFEAYSAKTDRVQRSLVGIAKAANRSEVGLDEILAIVLKNKAIISIETRASLAPASSAFCSSSERI